MFTWPAPLRLMGKRQIAAGASSGLFDCRHQPRSTRAAVPLPDHVAAILVLLVVDVLPSPSVIIIFPFSLLPFHIDITPDFAALGRGRVGNKKRLSLLEAIALAKEQHG